MNQVINLKDLEKDHKTLSRLIGSSIGNLPISNKLMFVEGGFESGMDKIIYEALARKHASGVRICPIGSVSNIITLRELSEELKRNFIGTDFSMIRDRDKLSPKTIEKLEEKGLKCTTRRHIENYLLESDIIHTIATRNLKIQINQSQVETRIKKIAKDAIGYTLYKNANSYILEHRLNGLPKESNIKFINTENIINIIVGKNTIYMEKFQEIFSGTRFKEWLESEARILQNSLNDPNENWKNILYGKEIFKDICHEILKGKSQSDVASLYIDEVISQGRDYELFGEFIDHLKELDAR